MKDPAFSDEELAAFLDGETTEAVADKIREAVASDTELSSYVDKMRAAQATFVSGQNALLEFAPDMPELPTAEGKGVSWGAGLTGLAAGLILALGASWAAFDSKEPGWREVVASYQSLYVTETLSGAVPSPVAAQAKLAQLSDVLGIDLTSLPEVDGLAYRRAQQLGYKGQPLAQLTYLTAEGGPVALCILYTGDKSSADIRAETLEGMSAFSWIDNGYGVLLIGPKGDSTLEGAAEVFRNALRGASA